MCGRYTYKLSWKQVVELYRLTLPEEPPPLLRESYNVAPTDVMPISGRGPTELAADMMKPYGGELEIWEVGAAIGNVRNNGPELMEPVA